MVLTDKDDFKNAVEKLQALYQEEGFSLEDFEKTCFYEAIEGYFPSRPEFKILVTTIRKVGAQWLLRELAETTFPGLDVQKLLSVWGRSKSNWLYNSERDARDKREKKEKKEREIRAHEQAEKEKQRQEKLEAEQEKIEREHAERERKRQERLKAEQEKRAREEIERERKRQEQLEAEWKNNLPLLEEILRSDFESADQRVHSMGNIPPEKYHELKNAFVLRILFAAPASINLSAEQLSAIGNSDKSVLLRARAGSGKTTVIKQKVNFAIRHLGFSPQDIMVLAFNKAAASQVKRDLQEGYNHITFDNARTFHSLSFRIVKPTQELLFDIDTGSNARQSQFIEGLLEKENNPRFRKDLYEFFRAELAVMENIGTLLPKEDYYTFRRNEAQDTLGGDPVKSIGEKWIADFLFEHDIRYMYERAWYRDKTGEQGNYHPDFSLAVNSNIPDVVIEHWGIDELDFSQSVPEHWDQTWAGYHDDMERKRQYWDIWNHNNPQKPVKFLETSIRDTGSGRAAFERRLKSLLGDNGVRCAKLPDEILIEKVVRKHTARFSRMCLQFMQRAKKQLLTPGDIDQKIAKYTFSCEKEQVFNLIANRIFHRYATALEEQNYIDFDDLVDRATKRIKEEKGNVIIDPVSDGALNISTLKWLMIDEYQDFSPLFSNLVSALHTYNPSLKLFCVGDDWQAINGFAGADLKYFNEFTQHFSDSTLLDLQNNYRSQPNIVAQGNAFMANRQGAPSIPKAPLPREPIRLVYSNKIVVEQRSHVTLEKNPDKRFMTHVISRGEWVNCDKGCKMARLFKACYSIMLEYQLNSTSFMILNRNNYLGYKYEYLAKFKAKLKSCFDKTNKNRFRDFDAQVQCLTAHSSKGKEADVVIILNVLDRRFPTIHPDNELYRLLGNSIDKVYSEEERLFYVSITRAKQSLYVLTEVERESEFLERIQWVEHQISNWDEMNSVNT